MCSVAEFIFYHLTCFSDMLVVIESGNTNLQQCKLFVSHFLSVQPECHFGFFGLAVSWIQGLIYKTVPEIKQGFNNSLWVGVLFAWLEKNWLTIQNNLGSLLREVKKCQCIFVNPGLPPLLLGQDLICCLAAAVNIPDCKFHCFIHGCSLFQGHAVKMSGYDLCAKFNFHKLLWGFSWGTETNNSAYHSTWINKFTKVERC